MPNFKITLTHEHEEQIVNHCVKNNLDFNIANAYSLTLEAFKDNPIVYRDHDSATGKEVKHVVTGRIARLIECQPKTVERIAEKVTLAKDIYDKNEWAENIAQAKAKDAPNIKMLVENLYRLNIVDGYSYLGLVCFLMQLKQTRNGDIEEDDKSCVFFNGVARNGKSATAKAICDVESKFGTVFKARSGKLLESTHEEQVWKSHLNYFDEVKPTDVDRELLLTIVNGGNVELNPKNKKQYNYRVKTNNIFTSNDQISLKQRRVSVIKFGNRLNGRPLENGTLKQIISDIMVSLPSFDHYYEIYKKVSVYNENRLNPLAIEAIITYLSEKLGFVNETEERTLTATKTFAAHDIYNCIKDTYSKQIISSERREAVKTSLDYFVEKGLLENVEYKNCTTRNFKVTGTGYLKIMEAFNKLNTKDEANVKISKTELYELLLPYYGDNKISDTKQKVETVTFDLSSPFSLKSETIKLVDTSVSTALLCSTEKLQFISADDKKQGTILYYTLLKSLKKLKDSVNFVDECASTDSGCQYIIRQGITKEMCQYLTLGLLCEILEQELPLFNDSHKEILKEVYIKHTGITDPETLKMSEMYKLSEVQKGYEPGFTMESAWAFGQKEMQREKEERVNRRKEIDQARRLRKKQVVERSLSAKGNDTTDIKPANVENSLSNDYEDDIPF